MAVIGIDLGTTNSCAAVLSGDQPSIIANGDFLKNHKDAVAAFVKVTQKAFHACAENAAPCIDALVEALEGEPDSRVREAFLVRLAQGAELLASDMPGHRSFAAMAVSTIGSALVGDLVFLPALLAFFGDKRPRPAVGDA